MIRGVLFDMDGVLLDSERLGREVIIGQAKLLGYNFSQELYLQVLGVNQQTGRQVYRERFGEDFPAQELERRFFEAMTDAARRGALPLKPGLKQCMDGLKKRGIRRALATSSERTIVEFYQAHNEGFRGLFDEMVCGMEAPSGKPAPDIYLLAAKKLGLSPEECVGVEDSRNGVKSLRAAGCTSVMIPDLLPYDDSLAAYVDTVLPSLFDLCGFIDRLNGVTAQTCQ